MSDFKEKYILDRQEFGTLFPYIANDDVEEIFWNGRGLWIYDRQKGSYEAANHLSKTFVKRFGAIVSACCGAPFGKDDPVLELNRDKMTIQLIHGSVSLRGDTIFIKKSKEATRSSAKELVEKGILDERSLEIIKSVMKDRSSFVIVGGAGVGKRQLMRFMSRYILPEDRVVSLDKEPGLKLSELNPEKDITELSIDQRSHSVLSDVCRGLNPKWIIAAAPDGGLICRIVELMNMWGMSGGIMVAADDPKDVGKNLFPWEDERKRMTVLATLHRVFPIWISMDNRGVCFIASHTEMKAEELYRR